MFGTKLDNVQQTANLLWILQKIQVLSWFESWMTVTFACTARCHAAFLGMRPYNCVLCSTCAVEACIQGHKQALECVSKPHAYVHHIQTWTELHACMSRCKYAYVHIHVCVYVCMYVYTYVRAYTCIRMCKHEYMRTCMHGVYLSHTLTSNSHNHQWTSSLLHTQKARCARARKAYQSRHGIRNILWWCTPVREIRAACSNRLGSPHAEIIVTPTCMSVKSFTTVKVFMWLTSHNKHEPECVYNSIKRRVTA